MQTLVRCQRRKEDLRPPQAGFNLVELLVVIAIIAILASFLLPALSAAKERGRTAVCMSNLHQLGIALEGYVDDFGAYPLGWTPALSPTQFGNPDVYPTTWYERMYPYTKDRWEDHVWDIVGGGRAHFQFGLGIWSCPSLTVIDGSWPYRIRTIDYNLQGCSLDRPRPTLGLEGNATGNPPLMQYYPTRESDVTVPADMIAMGDADATVLQDRWPPPGPPAVVPRMRGGLSPVSAAGWIEAGIVPDQPANRALKVWQRAIQQRHGGRWQTQFCDGHVEKMRAKDRFDIRQDAVRKRWNRDNAPHPELTMQLEPLFD